MFQPTAPRQIDRASPSILARIGTLALVFALTACAADGTSFSRATGTQRQAAIDSLKNEVPPQSTEMARGQCWMKYENSKVAHNLDEKMKLVDQCMEEKKRQYPLVVQ
jgi:hypothetical protein